MFRFKQPKENQVPGLKIKEILDKEIRAILKKYCGSEPSSSSFYYSFVIKRDSFLRGMHHKVVELKGSFELENSPNQEGKFIINAILSLSLGMNGINCVFESKVSEVSLRMKTSALTD